MGSPQAPLSSLKEEADSIDTPIHASQCPSNLGQRAGFLCRGERQEICRGGEGRPPGRQGEQHPRNTAVPANVLQQSCRDPGLQMYRWGCWLAAPLLGPRGSTCGPLPRLPKNPEAWPRLARPPARPLLPPHSPVARAQGTLLWPSPDSPQSGFQRGAESGPDADWPSPRGPLQAARAEHEGLHRTAGRRSLLAAPNAYPTGSGLQPSYCLSRSPGGCWSFGCRG